MSAALSDHQALDLCTAGGAWFTCAPIDVKLILEIPAAIRPIYAGTIVENAFLEYRTDRV